MTFFVRLFRQWLWPLLGPIWSIILFKRGPEDLPSSPIMLTLSFGLLMVTNAVVIALYSPDQLQMLIVGVLEPFVCCLFVWVILSMVRLLPRFLQTASAMLCSVAFFNVFWGVRQVLQPEPEALPWLAAMLSFIGLFALMWWLAVIARIFRSALDVNVLTSYGVALVYTILIIFIESTLMQQLGVS